jgi:uncharacterized membrane protein
LLVVMVILGALFGGAWGNGLFGATVGALLAWLLVRSFSQERRIAELQRTLQALHRGLDAEPAPVPAVAPVKAAPTTAATAPDGEPEAAAPADAADTPLSTMPLPLPLPLLDAAPARQPVPEAAATPAAPSPWAIAKAWLLGGNTIAKAGVGILFIGLAFLAKYASEHAQIPVQVRLAGIGAVALALLGLGWRLRHTRPAYAQALQGGAVAVLYLTLFVAFRFYGVLAVGPVFGLMVLVAALAAALAVLQDARALAVIGALGGFATPLLVSTGGGNQVALFSYYLVLDLGIAAVAWFKTWRLLNVVGFLFTFGVATAWGLLSYGSDQYASSQGFLVAYFLLFNLVLMLPARRLASAPAPQGDRWVNGSLLFGLPTISFVLQHGLVRHWPYGTALSALGLAAFYVGMAARMKRHPQLAVTFDGTLAIATLFLTLVIPFALDARSTGGAWALEGAGLLWLGLRQQRRLPRAFGYALIVLAGGSLVLARDWHGTPTAFFNAWFMNALLLAAGALAGAFFVQRARPAGALMARESDAEPLLIAWGTLWALAAMGAQIRLFATEQQSVAAWLASLSALALLYTALAVRLRWKKISLPLMAFGPLLLPLLVMSAWLLQSPVQAGGWWAWPLALLAHGAVLGRAAPLWPALARRGVHALGLLLLAAWGALQGAAITRDWGDAHSAWGWLGWLAVPALLLLLLPHPATARRWPFSAEPAAYQQGAGAVLTTGLLLWTLLANAFSDGTASPLPHVPLLNPLDLGIATALLAAVLWLRSAAARSSLASQAQLPAALLGGTGFVWLNAMLVRGFHHYAGVPYRFDDWTASLAVQTGVTLLWSATALVLMWLSARRGLRVLWMVGAALLAAVVFKLLLVDLSGSGTVTRIVSFIGVGLLMLVIAYVAPLPANESPREAR